ncbi:MAG: hypothetical protein NC093_02110 [Alistipes sp.]|nr:hypothetical protein [Alistipes sp.]
MTGTLNLTKQTEKIFSEELDVMTAENHYDLSAKNGNFAAADGFENYLVRRFSETEDERESEIWALVKDIQGHGMNFFEEALAISSLIRHYGLTQEDAAQKLGRAQSTIANKLRLLRLTETERDLILSNGLTERHARSLLKLASTEDRMVMLERIIGDNLNVERTENVIEHYIGRQKVRNSYKKRSSIVQNIKYFGDTVSKNIKSMQANGLLVNSEEIREDSYIEYRVKIFLKK